MKEKTIAEWRGRLAESEKALSRAEKRYGPDHHKLCRPLIDLATAHLYNGNQREAIELFQRCYDIYSKVPDPKPEQLYEIYSSQALARTMSGDQAEAISWFRRALGALDGYRKDCRHERISILHTLGSLHTSLYQAKEAEESFAKALQLCHEGPRRIDKEVPGLYQSLSNLFLDLEHHDNAEYFCRRALESERRISGDKTKLYASSLSRLGKLAMLKGDFSEAEKLLNEAIRIKGELVGALHPDYALSLLNIGELHTQMGEFEKAEQVFYHVMTIADGSLAPGHFLQWMVRHQFARLYIARGFLETAEGHLNRALEILESTAGQSNPRTVPVLLTLAGLHLENKCAEAALECYQRALDIVANTYGQGHPMAAQALHGMAGACEDLGRGDVARKHRARAEEIRALLEQNGHAPKSGPHPENLR